MNVTKYDYYSKIPNGRDIVNNSTKSSPNTEIGYVSGEETEEDRIAHDIIKKHYEKVHRENISHSNPDTYIFDKYYNKHSPYFRSDMSEQQRMLAAHHEEKMLETNGKYDGGMCWLRYDYALKDYKGLYNGPKNDFGVYNSLSKIKEKQYARTVINQQISKLFQKNGIEIGGEENFKFKIDPYSYEVSVEGNVDVQKQSLIEKLLNQGSNGENLWNHVWWSMHDVNQNMVNSQISKEKQEHFALWHTIKQTTGYDVREAVYKKGKYLLKDGTDLLAKYKEMEPVAAGFEDYSGYMKKYVTSSGWNMAKDPVLEIGFNKNGLYDIGQEQGYGVTQTSWIDAANLSVFDVSV